VEEDERLGRERERVREREREMVSGISDHL
jgi:hypothetical protein